MTTQAPVDFGYDTSCQDSLRTGRFSSGVRLVAEALYRRLTTPHGMLQGGEAEQDYGLDLVDLIGSVQTVNDAAALEDQIQAECLKDERVETTTVKVISTEDNKVISWRVTIDVTTGAGPFTLLIGVSSVTAQLLGIQAGT